MTPSLEAKRKEVRGASLGDKSREIRKALGLSQTQLSEIVGSPNYKLVGRWETGSIKGPPSPHDKEKFDALYLKVQHIKEHPDDGADCKFCGAKISVIESMYDEVQKRFLCVKCYHILNS
jgi:transcriptional regulator with XRE-family HTH domain